MAKMDKFILPKLLYNYDALEPYIDTKTMEIHYTKHHQTYIDKLNAAIEGTSWQGKPVEELLKNLNVIPEQIRKAVRNHGGGHFNHSFFWPLLKKDVKIKGEILKAIEKKFGRFDKFKEEFSNAALTLFGSGWVWLVLNKGELEILQTPNQDCPLSEGKIPILGLDMWEHAFYLKWQSNKGGYVNSFFSVVNWDQVNDNYKKAKK